MPVLKQINRKNMLKHFSITLSAYYSVEVMSESVILEYKST